MTDKAETKKRTRRDPVQLLKDDIARFDYKIIQYQTLKREAEAKLHAYAEKMREQAARAVEGLTPSFLPENEAKE